MINEIAEQLEHLIAALEADLYHPLGNIVLEGFRAPGALTLAEAETYNREPFPEGTAWGSPWDYAWMFGSFTIPEEARGERIVGERRHPVKNHLGRIAKRVALGLGHAHALDKKAGERQRQRELTGAETLHRRAERIYKRIIAPLGGGSTLVASAFNRPRIKLPVLFACVEPKGEGRA